MAGEIVLSLYVQRHGLKLTAYLYDQPYLHLRKLGLITAIQ
jgi:hypothetical protein